MRLDFQLTVVASTAYAGGIHIAFVMASHIDAEATNKYNGLITNSKAMEDFMLGALGNQKAFRPKRHAGVENLGIGKESDSRDATCPLARKQLLASPAQRMAPARTQFVW